MATITGADYTKSVNRTRIESPEDAALAGNVTVTLVEPPIGQPNFVKNQTVLVVRTHDGGTQNMQGQIDRVYGPLKYSIRDLQ